MQTIDQTGDCEMVQPKTDSRAGWATRIACAVLVAVGVSVAGANAATIRVGMVPDAGATQISVEEKAPLRAYLEKAIGQPVELIIPTSYNATVEGLGNGSLDVAYLGGLTYLKARARYGVAPLVQRDEDQRFHSLLITQAESPIKTLSDLKGKRFAFGDINSTSGHMFPYLAMSEAGIDPDKDITFRYTGSHAATIKAVEAGAADAGATDETVFKQMTSDGKADPAKLRVFYQTPPFVDYVWVARKDLDEPTRGAIIKAFTSLEGGHAEDDRILDILRGKHFVPANDMEYDQVRTIAKRLGLF
jgi:phosphonate transport system substrate-binding protein